MVDLATPLLKKQDSKSWSEANFKIKNIERNDRNLILISLSNSDKPFKNFLLDYINSSKC